MRFRYSLDTIIFIPCTPMPLLFRLFRKSLRQERNHLAPQERRNNARASHDNGIGKTGLELSADGFVHESGFLLAQEIRGTKMPEPLRH